MARQTAPNRSLECHDAALAKDPGAFNAHRSGGRGSALVQSVFSSPARPPPRCQPANARAPRRQAKNALHWTNPLRGSGAASAAMSHRQRWPRNREYATIEKLGRHRARNPIVRQSLLAILVDRLSQPRVAPDTQRCLQRFDSAADLKQTKPILARSTPYPHWLYPPHRVFHRSAGRHWPTFTTIAPGINSTAPASASRGDRLG